MQQHKPTNTTNERETTTARLPIPTTTTHHQPSYVRGGTSGSNEAEFGFWPPFLDEAKAGRSFLFFSSPEGQLPRRGILIIGAGPSLSQNPKIRESQYQYTGQ